MDDREFEKKLEQLLQADLSVGTEAFRDALLARCLKALPEAIDEPQSLEDADLVLLAAAGNVYAADDSISSPSQKQC